MDLQLQVGFSEVDLTPDSHILMAGMFQPRPFESIHTPIMVHAVVLEAGETRLALVSCDVISLRHRAVAEARARIETLCGIPQVHIAIFATHTHNGPFVCSLFGQKPDEDYANAFTAGIIDSVIRAVDDLSSASLSVGSAFEGRISFNRRYFLKDGRVLFQPPRALDDLAYVEGPKDPEVGALCFRRTDGTTAGFLVNFACHATAMGPEPQLSADYPGCLRQTLKQKHGEQCAVVFGNGAFGNIVQINYDDPDVPAFGSKVAMSMGAALAEKATTAVSSGPHYTKIALDAVVKTITIPRRDPATSLYNDVMISLQADPLVEDIYVSEQAELRQMVQEQPNEIVEIQMFRVGPAALVMIPGELFVELGLKIKLKSPIKPTFVIGQANGTIGYVPTRQAFDGGGYEVRTATSSRLMPEAGERIVSAVLDVLNSLTL